MDIPLVEDCDPVSLQWFVKCDITDILEESAFDNLHIITNYGDVINSEEQVVDVGPDIELLELFFAREQIQGKTLPQELLGPAYISNYGDFQITNDQIESSGFALAPALLGTIAEGLAMTTTNIGAYIDK